MRHPLRRRRAFVTHNGKFGVALAVVHAPVSVTFAHPIMNGWYSSANGQVERKSAVGEGK
jgi:hypothetical protein